METEQLWSGEGIALAAWAVQGSRCPLPPCHPTTCKGAEWELGQPGFVFRKPGLGRTLTAWVLLSWCVAVLLWLVSSVCPSAAEQGWGTPNSEFRMRFEEDGISGELSSYEEKEGKANASLLIPYCGWSLLEFNDPQAPAWVRKGPKR